VDGFLALAIDAAAKALGTKFVVRDLVRHPGFSVGAEQFNVLADNPIVFLLQELLFVEQISGSHMSTSL
jgi:hypothetical protein